MGRAWSHVSSEVVGSDEVFSVLVDRRAKPLEPGVVEVASRRKDEWPGREKTSG